MSIMFLFSRFFRFGVSHTPCIGRKRLLHLRETSLKSEEQKKQKIKGLSVDSPFFMSRGRRPDVPLRINSDLRSVGLSRSPTPTMFQFKIYRFSPEFHPAVNVIRFLRRLEGKPPYIL